LGSQVQET